MRTVFMRTAQLIVTLAACSSIQNLYADQSSVADGLVEAVGFGTVDTAKTANRTQARLMAKRAAIVDAQRNLLEMIDGVRITSGTTVKDAQLESDIIGNRIKGLLKGAFILKQELTEEDDTYLYEVTMGVCLNASLESCRSRPNLAQIIYESLTKTPVEDQFTATLDSSAPRASSLIVDLGDYQFSPYFDVRLVNASGKEIYGPGQFDPTKGNDWVHWEKSMTAARASAIAGESPFEVSAAGTTLDSDIVLSDEDAERLYSTNANSGNFLEQGKVIFVIKSAGS
ncbi:MAG: hypothetical protein VB957_18005 [Pseudomonadales bacterium]